MITNSYKKTHGYNVMMYIKSHMSWPMIYHTMSHEVLEQIIKYVIPP